MLGYTFTTELEAQSARQSAADYMGLPVDGGTTLYWVDYQYSNLDNIYFIQYEDGLENVLGQPIEFTITQEKEK